MDSIFIEPSATREKENGSIFREPNAEYLTGKEVGWRNKLIWGDNKYVMSALLEQYAGKIDLIYIDPPFATGANFSFKTEVGDDKNLLRSGVTILIIGAWIGITKTTPFTTNGKATAQRKTVAWNSSQTRKPTTKKAITG